MAKLIAFFLVMFIGASIFSAIIEGGGGIATTRLTAAIDDDDTTIPVESTDQFLSSDYIVIGNEEIFYTGKTAVTFTGATRGYHDTVPTYHADDSLAMTEDSSAVNNALGFNVMAEADKSGAGAILTVPVNFFTKTIPNIIQMNWAFLDGQMAIVAYFFFAMAAGLIITLGIAILQAIF